MESVDGLKQIMGEAGMAPGSEKARKLLIYLELLQKWNARINLTASTEWRSLRPLFLEGIRASKIYPPEANTHLDIGSGAGFPAIILRILVPRIQLELVEGRGKRSFFLETVLHTLHMDNSFVHVERLEMLLQGCDPGRIWDCITWKGLKLNARDLTGLLRHANDHTQFWMFHGRELAVEEPEHFGKFFRLLRREQLDEGKYWMLSIYSRQSAAGSRQP